ncbi:MAG: hypothetical protein AAFV07_04090 [Bacteroidota bacterium]
MYRILLGCTGLLWGSLLWAQMPTYPYVEESRIYLQNGNVIHGQIHSTFEADTIEVFMAGGSFVRLPKTRIDSIRHGEGRFQQFYREYNDIRPIRYPVKGVYQRLEMGLTFYRQEVRPWVNTAISSAIMYSLGARRGERLNVGAGLGIQGYVLGAMMPVFVEVTGDIVSGHNALFYLGQAGLGVPLSRGWNVWQWDPGPFGRVGLGWHIHGRGSVAWQFSLSYSFQYISVETDDCFGCQGVVRQQNTQWFNGFTYGMGIEFGGKE